MNEFDKILILEKIDEELKHLDAKKSAEFKKFLQKDERAVKRYLYREFDRIASKMDGIFPIRGLITGCESVVCYQERTTKTNKSQNY